MGPSEERANVTHILVLISVTIILYFLIHGDLLTAAVCLQLSAYTSLPF